MPLYILILLFLVLSTVQRASAQVWSEEFCKQGYCTRGYIAEIKRLDNCRLRFREKSQTAKDIYNGGSDYKSAPIELGEWRVADCCESKLDGNLVPAVPRSGAELTQPETLRSVCNSGN